MSNPAALKRMWTATPDDQRAALLSLLAHHRGGVQPTLATATHQALLRRKLIEFGDRGRQIGAKGLALICYGQSVDHVGAGAERP